MQSNGYRRGAISGAEFMRSAMGINNNQMARMDCFTEQGGKKHIAPPNYYPA